MLDLMMLDGPYSIPCNLTMDALIRCLLSSKFCWTCSTCRPFTHSVLWQSAPWLWSSYNPNRDQRLKAWHKVGVKGRYSLQGHSKPPNVRLPSLVFLDGFGHIQSVSMRFNPFQPFQSFSLFFVGWCILTSVLTSLWVEPPVLQSQFIVHVRILNSHVLLFPLPCVSLRHLSTNGSCHKWCLAISMGNPHFIPFPGWWNNSCSI